MKNTQIGNGQYVEKLIKSLKEKGYSISTIHWRKVRQHQVICLPNGTKTKEYYTTYNVPLFEIRRKGLTDMIEARGGYTTVRIINPKTKVDVVGESTCCDIDAFQNKLGFRRGLSDALKKLSIIDPTIFEDKVVSIE